jgi:hypothetical protein
MKFLSLSPRKLLGGIINQIKSKHVLVAQQNAGGLHLGAKS